MVVRRVPNVAVWILLVVIRVLTCGLVRGVVLLRQRDLARASLFRVLVATWMMIPLSITALILPVRTIPPFPILVMDVV